MNKQTAKAIIDDSDYVKAFLFWQRFPMKTSDETFRIAMDYCQALLSN